MSEGNTNFGSNAELIKFQEEKLFKLRAEEMNLKTSIENEKLKLEASRKIEEVKQDRNLAHNLDSVQKAESRLRSREASVEILESQIRDRLFEVTKREQELLGLENKRIALMEKRSNFERYRKGVEADLEKAKNIIQEASVVYEDIRTKQENLKAHNKAIIVKEKYWNDRYGELAAKEKEFKILVEHLESLKGVVINV